METNTKVKFTNVDEYISSKPKQIQKLLEQIRATVRKSAPEAEEIISYQMPAFKYNGIIIYFASYKNHIGVYMPRNVMNLFSEQLAGYTWSKATLKLPLDKPIPKKLISDMVKYRIAENSLKIMK